MKRIIQLITESFVAAFRSKSASSNERDGIPTTPITETLSENVSVQPKQSPNRETTIDTSQVSAGMQSTSYIENEHLPADDSPSAQQDCVKEAFTDKSAPSLENPSLSSSNLCEEPEVGYVETPNMIYRTDGKPISDEEIPSLIQIGYEEALQKAGLYKGQVVDLSSTQEKDKNKKEYTRIPSYDELSIVEPSEFSICSTDIFFLKYIDGLCLVRPSIAQYWYYDYGLNYSEEIKKLVSVRLLTVSSVNINKANVEEMKSILKHFGLPLTGKKVDLKERILFSIPNDALSDYLGNETQYFCATSKGKSLIDNIHESATKNLELENDCINSIMNYNFEIALSLINGFQASTPNGTHSFSCSTQIYSEIMDNSSVFYTLVKDRDIEQRIRAGIVFCRMYGCSQDKILKLMQRIYEENNRVFDENAKKRFRRRLL